MENYPYRIEVYLHPDRQTPDFVGASEDLDHPSAIAQGKIILKRFLAHHVRIVPIIIGGRWSRKSETAIADLTQQLTKTIG